MWIKWNFLLIIKSIAVFLIGIPSLAAQIMEDYRINSSNIPNGLNMRVYYPKGYNKDDAQKYNVLIYLHGGRGSNNQNVSTPVSGAASELITNRLIKPLIVVFPDLRIESFKKPNLVNGHMYSNSEYFGNFETAVLEDVIGWLKNTTSNNLAAKISTERNSMALGGFSMGAYGSVKLLLKYPDKFIAAVSNGIYIPSFDIALLYRLALTPALQEDNRTAGKFDIAKADNNLYGSILFALSAVFIGMKDGQIQLLLNNNGDLNQENYKIFSQNCDLINQLKNNQVYASDKKYIPNLYFEMGSKDEDKAFFDYFSNQFVTIAPNSTYKIEITSDGVHEISIDRVKNGLIWLNRLFEENTTSIHPQANNSSFKYYVSSDRRLRFKDQTITSTQPVFYLYALDGKIIHKSKVDYRYDDQSDRVVDLSEIISGVYFFSIDYGNNLKTGKIILN